MRDSREGIQEKKVKEGIKIINEKKGIKMIAMIGKVDRRERDNTSEMKVLREKINKRKDQSQKRGRITRNQIRRQDKTAKLLVDKLLKENHQMNNQTREIHNLALILSQNYNSYIEFRRNSQINS